MTHKYQLTFTLLSDATFGRGEGIAGLIDREVEHDRYGLPYLRGRTLKGLVSEEADNILFALRRQDRPTTDWEAARQTLFGRPGSVTDDRSRLRFGHAELPEAVRAAVLAMRGAGTGSNRLVVLESLTTVRRQTAIESEGERYGVPVDGSLRAMRVILRQTHFEARLLSEAELSEDEQGLLAAAVLAFRRVGTGRNRGRGKLEADLLDDSGVSLLKSDYYHFIHKAFGNNVAKEATS